MVNYIDIGYLLSCSLFFSLVLLLLLLMSNGMGWDGIFAAIRALVV